MFASPEEARLRRQIAIRVAATRAIITALLLLQPVVTIAATFLLVGHVSSS